MIIFKHDGFILSCSIAKPETPLQHRDQYSKGHEKAVWDMQDVVYKLENCVIAFIT